MRKFKPFGSVDGHQRNMVPVRFITVICIGDQGHFLHEFTQCPVRELFRLYVVLCFFLRHRRPGGVAKLPDSVQQLFDILKAAYPFRRLVFVQIFQYAGAGCNMTGQSIGVFLLQLDGEAFDHGGKTLQLLTGGSIDVQPVIHWVCNDLPGRNLPVTGGHDDFLHRRLADAPGRVIDDAGQGILVPVVDRQAEIGQYILDLLALVK